MEGKLRIQVIGLIKFIIVWLLNGVVWWYFRSYLNFVFGVLMIIAVILSVLVLKSFGTRLVAGIEFTKGCIDRKNSLVFCVKIWGEKIWFPFETKVSYRIFNAFTNEQEEFTKIIDTVPRKGAKLAYTMILEHCGLIQGTINKFEVSDFLHIFKVEGKKRVAGQTMAYPRYQKTDYQEIFDLVENFPKEDEIKNKGNDYTLDCEVREYIEGDSLKNIHWKLTAKKDNLMIRERLATGKQRMNVLLQFERDMELNSELMDSLRWLLEELIEKEYPVQLFWWNSMEKQMKSVFVSESSIIEQVIYEILSMSSVMEEQNVIEQFRLEYKDTAYIVVRTGEKKGAYNC